MASTNTTSFAYIAEVTAGTTPATPAFQLLPVTSNSVASTLTTAVSNAIRDDRMEVDLIVTDKSVSGDAGFELSYAPWKPILESLMQNNTTSTVALTAVTAVGATSTLTKVGIHSSLPIGASIKVASVTDTTIDGTYIVTDNTTTDEVDVTPALPIAAAAIDLTVDISTIVSNGADVPDSYTIRTKMANTAGTPYYHYARGCQFGSASMNFATGSLVDGSIGIMGLTEEVTASAIAGETEVAIPSYEIMSAAASIGTVYVSGLTLGTCSFSNLSLSIDNQINEAKSISQLGACALASYTLQVTGDATFYFESIAAYQSFLDSTSFSVAFNVIDNTGNIIGFAMNNCKWESLSTPISGKDAFLEESGTFRALRDATTNSVITLFLTAA